MLNYNPMQDWNTFSGYTLEGALEKMGQILPPDAYKKVGGGNSGPELTDISPAYLTKTANEVFGPCGFGWKYDVDEQSVSFNATEKKAKSGREYTDYEFGLLLKLYIRYFDQDGNLHWSDPIIANGGNSNSDKGYAYRGALTNAIGSAFAKLNWQILVYMGKVHHNNAASLWKVWQERQAAAASGKPAKEEQAEESGVDASNEPVNEPVHTEPAPVAEEEAVEEPATKEYKKPRDYVIPKSIPVPLAGKTLGEVWDMESDLSKLVIAFLAGVQANAAGEKFVPKTVEEKQLFGALQTLMAIGG